MKLLEKFLLVTLFLAGSSLLVQVVRMMPSASHTVAVEITRVMTDCDTGDKKACEYLKEAGKKRITKG